MHAARAALRAAGVDDEANKLEAQDLICAAAGKTPEQLYRDFSLYTTDAIAETIEKYMDRRLAGEPIAYIVGEWDFMGLRFFVNPAALIPRVDTEMLAQLAISRLKEHPGHTRVLDLCAGTGCVGLSIAATLKNTRAILVDLSDGALALCKRNIRRHKLTGRAVYLKGDALQPPSHTLGQFDALVCNPPYIPTGDLPALDRSVKDYEPMLALDGGSDGLDFYRAVTTLWRPALKPGGHLLYEVGVGQAEHVAWMLVKAGYENIRITRDTGGSTGWSRASGPSSTQSQTPTRRKDNKHMAEKKKPLEAAAPASDKKKALETAMARSKRPTARVPSCACVPTPM